MEVKYLTVPFAVTELKADAAGWMVAGWASTFGGDPDSYSDVVVKGAFAKTLAQRPDVPLLWQHDQSDPIGAVISLSEEDKGLFGQWSLVDTDTGIKAHKLLEKHLIKALSIGFMTKEAEYREDGVRLLKEVELFEVSLVTLPANQNALISSFKTANLPFTTLLEQAGEALRLVTRSATALRERRAATNRPLNDQHTQAIADFLAEAQALTGELSALVVVGPEAKAPDTLEMLDLFEHELAIRRRRYHRPATATREIA